MDSKGLFGMATVAVLALGLSATPGTAVAQGAAANAFGQGFPRNVSDLPPGRLQSRLERLPPAAQRRALDWLQRFEFPAADVDTLRVDEEGGIFYSDEIKPEPVDSASEPSTQTSFSAADAFSLHSRPGAPNVIFIDFDGHVITGTAWNSYVGSDPLDARAFDIDGDPSSFNQDEIDRISEIWHRVAEDFAPFDVDVTTEEPVHFDRYTGHILVTTDTDKNGAAMPSKGAGGVAYVGVFGSSSYASYSPALVYFNNLGSGHPPYVAEAAAHEMGHNVGLSHDGTKSGTAYYRGHGSGFVSWAPIMGVGYYNNVTQWSKGEYADANNTQDDLAYLAADFGYISDDHGDSRNSATALFVDGVGSVMPSNPETDPGNFLPENKGIVDHRTDVDYFYVDTNSGTIDLSVIPAWDAYTRSGRRGANLDVEARLYDQSGSLIAQSDPLDNTDARVIASVTAGRYYLRVDGVDNATVPYSDYASVGMYFISGTVPAVTVDSEPPSPAVMSFASPPRATSGSTIEMTAVTAADASGFVEYFFECTTAGCADSGWQTGASYIAAGLAGASEYSFRVKARDAFGNENTWSSVASASTTNAPPVANDDSAMTSGATTIIISVLDNDTDADGHTLTVISAGPADNGTVTINDTSVAYTPNDAYVGSDSFSYTISDGVASDSATVTVVVEATPEPPQPPMGVTATNVDGLVTISWSHSGSAVSRLEIVREKKHKKRDAWNSTALVATVSDSIRTANDRPDSSGTYRYLVRAVNSVGNAESGWVEVSVAGGGGGGSNPKCHPRRGCG